MIDWDDIRYFHTVATCGGFSAAARELGVSQPTVGRRIALLEQQLGVTLLERESKSVRLNSHGKLLLEKITPWTQEAARLTRELEVFGKALQPPIRITSTEGLASYWLPAVLAVLQREDATARFVVVGGNQLENLAERAADIALRVGGEPPRELAVERLGHLGCGLWGSEDYLERHGQPGDEGDLHAHRLIAYSEKYMGIEEMHLFRHAGLAERIVLRADSATTQAQAAAEGLGLAVVPDYLAMRHGLKRCRWPGKIAGRAVSLVAHPSSLQRKDIQKAWSALERRGRALVVREGG